VPTPIENRLLADKARRLSCGATDPALVDLLKAYAVGCDEAAAEGDVSAEPVPPEG